MKTDGAGKTRSFLDPLVVARLSAIPLVARRSMLGGVSGRHTSPHRGSSVEFAEYRKYVPGDDLRRLDWRAFGRSDRYYVKEFEADTNLRCILVIDTSGSMAFGSVGKTKLEYARSLAATLGYLAIAQGDAVGMTCAAEKIVREIPARRNPSHLSHLLDEMEVVQAKGPTRLPEILHELAETVRQRALVLVFSDLFIEPSMLRNCFEHLRFRKHDVGVFHLLDPEELKFQFLRPTRFIDMEGGPSVFVEPNEIVDRYQLALQDYLAKVQKVVLETSTDYHRVSIDEAYEPVLAKFLTGRIHGRSRR
ncbi:MAG: DUF58 domain-containing protein [Pirellulaceae bacterium]|nr:DUF58 domain-containing protein [Pirellulaceae bacterium]